MEEAEELQDLEDDDDVQDMDENEAESDEGESVVQDMDENESESDEGESEGESEGEAESDEDESQYDDSAGESEEETSELRRISSILDAKKNVEFPVSNEELSVSWPSGRSEVTKPKVRTNEDGCSLILYLLGYGVSPGAACTDVQSVVCPTLPDGLVEEVLVLLPAAAQARCRAVCKAWLAMLDNPEFLQRSFFQSLSRTTPPLCAVVLSPHRYASKVLLEILGRGAPPCKSLKVDLSFLPEVFHSRKSYLHRPTPCGFVCISRRVQEGTHVCVLNPVNKSFKVLPMLQKLCRYGDIVLLMGTASATESIPSFKVYVSKVGPALEDFVGDGLFHEVFKDVVIYSSISGEWKGFVGEPGMEVDYSPAVACNRDFYTTMNNDIIRSQLVRLSTEPGPAYLWHLALPRFKKHRGEHWLRFCFLAAYCGRLVCYCGDIWMLDDDMQLWVRMSRRCPPDILPPGDKTQYLMLTKVVVDGDLVVFFYQLHFRSGDLGVVDCPVAYDMVGRSWQKFPQVICPIQKRFGFGPEFFQPMPNLRL